MAARAAGHSERAEMKIEQYPMGDADAVPRRLILAGKKEGGRLKAELIRLSGIAERKRSHTDASGSPSESVNWDHYGDVMAERRRREAEGR